MPIIAFIDVSEAIGKILKHIGLWDVKRKPAARVNAPPFEAFTIYLFKIPYVGLWLVPIHNSHFCIIHLGKSEFLSIPIIFP
jgi:hypothetical protein